MILVVLNPKHITFWKMKNLYVLFQAWIPDAWPNSALETFQDCWNPLLRIPFYKLKNLHTDIRSKTRPISLRERVRFVAEIPQVRAACCNNGELAVRRLQTQPRDQTGASECTFKWASVCVHPLIQITSIHSLALHRKKEQKSGLCRLSREKVTKLILKWSVWERRRERKREMERQKRKKERKRDEIRWHFGLSVGTLLVNAFWLIVTSMAADHPQTRFTPSPAGW